MTRPKVTDYLKTKKVVKIELRGVYKGLLGYEFRPTDTGYWVYYHIAGMLSPIDEADGIQNPVRIMAAHFAFHNGGDIANYIDDVEVIDE